MKQWNLLGAMVFVTGCFQAPTELVPCAADGSCAAGFVCSAARVCVPAADAGVNPCLSGNGGCDARTTCTSASGTVTCGPCPTGYTGSGATGCFDVNECASANGGCSPDATCANTAGGRTCACRPGYAGDGVTCRDVDECASPSSGCSADATCTNTPGGHACACRTGFRGDGVTCVDLDECATANGGCSPLATCTNTPGSRTCTCNTGYTGSGRACVDINECATGNGACDQLTTCTNTQGSRTCSACPAGYSGTGETRCADVDECATGNGGCDAVTTCTNTPGSRTCGACPTGYLGTGETGCRWDDPSLTGLTVTPGTLAFSPTTLLYVLEVPRGTTSVLVAPTVAVPSGVQLTVNGQSAPPGAGRVVALSGPTTIAVTAVATTGAQRTYTVVVFQGTAQQVYAKASNTGRDDEFGTSVALSADGSTMAVGARYEDSNATGVGGNQADDTATFAGAVYIFVRTGAIWTQQAYLKASNAAFFDAFGTALALSADGSSLAVGAPFEASSATGVGGVQANEQAFGSGAVYVFSRTGSAWTQQAYVKASNTDLDDQFGTSVAMSADGSTLAVGAVNEDSGATGVDGNQLDNSANNAGAVYVFAQAGATWSQQAYLKASTINTFDGFGWSLALSGTGHTLAVGVPGDDSNATGIGGNQADNTAADSGAVLVFVRAGGSWTVQAWLKASNTGVGDAFGSSVSLSAAGDTLAVGAPDEDGNTTGVGGNQADNSNQNSGAVYLFVRAGTSWAQSVYVKASNRGGGFGTSVSLSADGAALLVGAPFESSFATGVGGSQVEHYQGSFSGAAYLFVEAAGAWLQLAYVKASNTRGSASFGWNLALSADGHTLAVGAPRERSGATGLNGNQADNSLTRSGAVYVFSR